MKGNLVICQKRNLLILFVIAAPYSQAQNIEPAEVKLQEVFVRPSKYQLPVAAQNSAKASSISFIKSNDQVNHPNGSALFPGNGQLATLLDGFLKNIEQDSYFVVYFAKFHTLVLHELYQYLTKIYANFNMNHIDSISDYLSNENTFALNKKTLIINHLINIIEAQSNQAILALFPTFPKNVATMGGTLLLKNDYGSSLNSLMEGYEENLLTCTASLSITVTLQDNTTTNLKTEITTKRTLYTSLFGDYLKLFH